MRRLASAASGEAMKASICRTASAWADPAHTPAENVVVIWIGSGMGPITHVDALEVHQLAQLLEAQRYFTARDQGAHGHARRRLDDARLDFFAIPQRSKSLVSATPLGPVE